MTVLQPMLEKFAEIMKSLNEKSDNLKEKIEAKIGKLEKYFSDDIVANIMLSRERNRDKLEATINVKGTIFRAEEVSDDIYTSLDKAMDKLSGQMSRFKSRLQKKHKGGRDILATDAQLVRACELAQADEFVRQFPDGYDTRIEQGVIEIGRASCRERV